MKMLIALLGLAVPAAALAGDATPAPPAAKDKKICRRENVIGSVIPAHICLTKAEWAQLGDYYEKRDESFIERRKDQFNPLPKTGGGNQ